MLSVARLRVNEVLRVYFPTKTIMPVLDWAARQALGSSRASRLGMSRWGRCGSRRDTVPFFRLRRFVRKPRARSQVNVQSTGRWAGPVSASEMLPESAETLRQPCTLGEG